MFIHDKPIETEKDDFLGTARFSHHLGRALLEWKEAESLVIAMYGEWGSGKSSVINRTKEFIGKTTEKERPTIIEFNPWVFSEEDKLSEHFFSEIAEELEIRKDTEKDIEISKKLKYYASLLSLAPKKTFFSDISSKLIIGLGLVGISSGQIIAWLNLPMDWIKYFLFIGGFLLILLEIFNKNLLKAAEIFKKKADYQTKSVLRIKKEIKQELAKRQKKLIIVIDDIDRLNQSEIKQIFRLIRVNADFPNTIYLLSFDRKIIEKNLEEQVGISGNDYLNKIVQVNFDVPLIGRSKVETFLFTELDRILSVLPESAQEFFRQDDPRWVNVYHSGFKNFFKSIRDIKRYVSSLEFNISQMYQGEVMEVNPIDFFAIEAIRVFAPDFFLFMRERKSLFTSTDRGSTSRSDSPRRDEVQSGLEKLSDESKKSMTELLKRLFPQVDGVLEHGYSTHGHGSQSTWSNYLRVCATSNFDSYFTLIPGGGEEELSQFEIEEILRKTDSEEEFKNILRDFIGKGKIRKVLQRIQDFTGDQSRIPEDHVKNIVIALFNISDELPKEKITMWDYGADMDLMRIIHQLMKRSGDESKNFEILKEIIPSSGGLFGPVQRVSLESAKLEEGNDADASLISEENVGELQSLCLEKINNTDIDVLLRHNDLLYILYRWKEWDQAKSWQNFIDDVVSSDRKLLLLLPTFVARTAHQSFGDYGSRTTEKFNFEAFKDFADVDKVKAKLENIKNLNEDLYSNNEAIIDLFLNNFDNE